MELIVDIECKVVVDWMVELIDLREKVVDLREDDEWIILLDPNVGMDLWEILELAVTLDLRVNVEVVLNLIELEDVLFSKPTKINNNSKPTN